jgi:hypothetical protein
MQPFVGHSEPIITRKILATGLTIGIGGSGGVFAAALFIGAMLGAAFGTTVRSVLPDLTGAPGAYALVGMGTVFAGVARTPITVVVIQFELTGEYTSMASGSWRSGREPVTLVTLVGQVGPRGYAVGIDLAARTRRRLAHAGYPAR